MDQLRKRVETNLKQALSYNGVTSAEILQFEDGYSVVLNPGTSTELVMHPESFCELIESWGSNIDQGCYIWDDSPEEDLPEIDISEEEK